MAVGKFHGSGSESVIFVDFRTRSVTIGKARDEHSSPASDPLRAQLESLRRFSRGGAFSPDGEFEPTLDTLESSPSPLVPFEGETGEPLPSSNLHAPTPLSAAIEVVRGGSGLLPGSERGFEECVRLFAAVDANGDCLLSPPEQRRTVEAIRNQMGLTSQVLLKLDTHPRTGSLIHRLDSYAYISGEVLTRSARGHRAQVRFTLPYPFPPFPANEPYSYTLGGIMVTPSQNPGLPTALLRAVTNHADQGLVVLHNPSPSTFIVATGTMKLGKHLRPYHLYSITCSPTEEATIREMSGG